MVKLVNNNAKEQAMPETVMHHVSQPDSLPFLLSRSVPAGLLTLPHCLV